MARRHETVAAIIAGPAQYDDRPWPVTPHRRLGDRPSRSLHERAPGDAAGNRCSVGLGHLRAAQQNKIVVGRKVAHGWISDHGTRATGAADRT